MFPTPWQTFDTAIPQTAALSFRPLPPGIPDKATDLTDRQIELYLLPHPKSPSLSLQMLYAAVRQQMTLDGCP